MTLPGLVDDDTEFTYSSEHALRQTPLQHVKIEKAVEQARELGEYIEQLSSDLKLCQKQHTDLLDKQIPELMADCGVTELTLSKSGLKVSLTKQWWASIPSPTAINKEKDRKTREALIAKRNAALRWLDKNGHHHLIQRDFTIELSKGQEEEARILRETLNAFADDGSPMHYVEGENVNAQSLSKLVRELKADPETKDVVPMDILGVYEKTTTNITTKK